MQWMNWGRPGAGEATATNGSSSRFRREPLGVWETGCRSRAHGAMDVGLSCAEPARDPQYVVTRLMMKEVTTTTATMANRICRTRTRRR